MIAGRRAIDVVVQTKPVIDAETVHGELVNAALAAHAEQATAHEETLELGKLIGRIETAGFIGNISDSVRLSAYESAKKSKAYKKLIDHKTGNHFANIEDFCQSHLDRSSRRMDQVISNRNLVGATLFEQSEKLGLRQVDYNAIKALPVEDQAQIKKAIEETDSREGVLEILQELAAKHQREKESLTKEVADTKADLAASKTRTERADARANLLEGEIAALTATPKAEPTPDLIEAERLRFISDATLRIVAEVEAGLRSQFTLLEKLFPDGVIPNHARLAQQQALSQIIQSARVLAGDFGISLQLADLERPELLWMTQGEAVFGPETGSGDSLIDADDEGSEN